MFQNNSKIYKADFRLWESFSGNQKSDIFKSDCFRVQEIVLRNQEDFFLNFQEGTQKIILPLLGNIIVNEEMVHINEIYISQKQIKNYIIKNTAESEADFLVFEIKSNSNLHEIDKIVVKKNTVNPISEKILVPNYICLYDGRKEGSYTIQNIGKSIFTIVINGAFEFQNRLLETRDAVLIVDAEQIEFEALSENALLLFFEI